MMAAPYPLLESGSATADATGRAVVSLAAHRAFEQWIVTRITINSTSTTKSPTCKMYRGAEQDSRLIDGSYTGTLDHSDTNLPLQNGEAIIAVWTGCDTGATCTLTVEGESRRG